MSSKKKTWNTQFLISGPRNGVPKVKPEMGKSTFRFLVRNAWIKLQDELHLHVH